MPYFGAFCCLNSHFSRKSITSMFMISFRDEYTLLKQNSVTDVSVGFDSYVGAHQMDTNMASPYKAL